MVTRLTHGQGDRNSQHVFKKSQRADLKSHSADLGKVALNLLTYLCEPCTVRNKLFNDCICTSTLINGSPQHCSVRSFRVVFIEWDPDGKLSSRWPS
jgi:hypothetical protein